MLDIFYFRRFVIFEITKNLTSKKTKLYKVNYCGCINMYTFINLVTCILVNSPCTISVCNYLL